MKDPNKYRLTITVAPDDGEDSEWDGLELKCTYEGINRSDIINPTYGDGGIAAMVRAFEADARKLMESEESDND